jgi:hypothetical protein
VIRSQKLTYGWSRGDRDVVWKGYGSLEEQEVYSLVAVSTLVGWLLIYESMMPPELRARLDTYRAGLANAIEAKAGSRKAASTAPETGTETADA